MYHKRQHCEILAFLCDMSASKQARPCLGVFLHAPIGESRQLLTEAAARRVKCFSERTFLP